MGTHVTEESWFSRIGGAIKGILIGGLLTVVSVPVLFWNEGRAVKTAKGLKEGAKVVVDIQPDQLDPINEGKFVHTTGLVATDDVLRDDEFALEFNGIRLSRHVEMYQWDEDEDTNRKKKFGGSTQTTTTFSYSKGWFPRLNDSSQFDEADAHRNPSSMLFADQSQQAKQVSLGQFGLPDSLIGQISGGEAVDLTEENLPASFRGRSSLRRDGPGGSPRLYVSVSQPKNPIEPSTGVRNNLIDLEASNSEPDASPANPDRPDLIDLEAEQNPTTSQTSATDDESLAGDELGDDSADNLRETGPAQIGDTRIWFTATPVQTISLLSQQAGETFQPYETQTGTTINILQVGTATAAEMIAGAEATNQMVTWLLRGGGALVMFIGLSMLLRPLVVLADVLPIAGSLVGFGTAIVAGLLTIAGSLTVIGIAWVFYRPLLGISLLAVAGVAIYFLVKRARNKKAQLRKPDTLTEMDLA